MGQPHCNKRNSYLEPEAGAQCARIFHVGFEEYVMTTIGHVGLLMTRSLYSILA